MSRNRIERAFEELIDALEDDGGWVPGLLDEARALKRRYDR